MNHFNQIWDKIIINLKKRSSEISDNTERPPFINDGEKEESKTFDAMENKIKFEEVKKYIKVKCPICEQAVKGEIKSVPGIPHLSYYAYCKDCNYDITESEFEEVE